MTERENNIHKAAREHSGNRDNRMSFCCGARWADNHPNAIDMSYLQNWYQRTLLTKQKSQFGLTNILKNYLMISI